MESVRKVSGGCLDSVWKVSGECSVGVWRVSKGCLATRTQLGNFSLAENPYLQLASWVHEVDIFSSRIDRPADHID